MFESWLPRSRNSGNVVPNFECDFDDDAEFQSLTLSDIIFFILMSSTNAFQALFFEFFIFQELFPENVNGRIRSWVVQRRAECWPALFLQIISETSTPIANMVRDVFVEKNVRKKIMYGRAT